MISSLELSQKPDGYEVLEVEVKHCVFCDTDVPEHDWDDDMDMCIFCSIENYG